MNCGAQTFPLNIIKKKETALVPRAQFILSLTILLFFKIWNVSLTRLRADQQSPAAVLTW
jgi:hypothetical protein